MGEAGYIACTGKFKLHTKFWSFRRFRYRWEYNIKTALKEIRLDEVDSIHMAQDRNHWWDLVNMVMNRGTVSISFSRRTLFHEVTQLLHWMAG
jgi:hypothetical protein